MSDVKRICVVTGTRAEFGLLRPVMECVRASRLELRVIASGMHLCHEFGNSWKEIEAAGFAIDARVDMILSGDSSAAMAKSIGLGITGMAQALENLNPEVVLVLGDRVEAFAGAVSAASSNRIVAHVHGGEVTQGGLDESMRHAITKLAHLHFVATEKSRQRVLGMGEETERVFVVGAPGLDAILSLQPLSRTELEETLHIKLQSSFLAVIQHPVTTEDDQAARQMTETLEALKAVGRQSILIYPNSDAGGRRVIDVIESHRAQPWLHVVRTLDHRTYLSLLKHASALVGNSSSGIIEAASFHLPVVNVGTRQAGRERSTNVLDAPYERGEIQRAIGRALADEALRSCVNPYGDGRASRRIVDVLTSTKIGPRLLQKRTTL